jgi:hypothetical protein
MANNEIPSVATDSGNEIARKAGEIIFMLYELREAGAYQELDDLSRAIQLTHLPAAVAVAREYGTPWSEIGKQLGTTRQAAQQRFSS